MLNSQLDFLHSFSPSIFHGAWSIKLLMNFITGRNYPKRGWFLLLLLLEVGCGRRLVRYLQRIVEFLIYVQNIFPRNFTETAKREDSLGYFHSQSKSFFSFGFRKQQICEASRVSSRTRGHKWTRNLTYTFVSCSKKVNFHEVFEIYLKKH